MKWICTMMLLTLMHTGNGQVQYDAGVSFTSIGTGTPSENFLLSFYKKCKKSTPKLKAYKLAGCGREGEFFIFFQTKGLTASQKNKFYKKLKDIVTDQDKKNHAKKTDTGNLTMLRKILPAEYEHCRIPAEVWPK